MANFDPGLRRERMRQVFAQQTRDGGGCFAFFPHNPIPTTDEPHRSDNTVWQIYTVKNLVAETGDDCAARRIHPFRDGGDATIYEHLLRGLEHIFDRRGPHGLPTLFDVDWNDSLALFQDPEAESVMLGMQLVYSCREVAEVARCALGARRTRRAGARRLAADSPAAQHGRRLGRRLVSPAAAEQRQRAGQCRQPAGAASSSSRSAGR